MNLFPGQFKSDNYPVTGQGDRPTFWENENEDVGKGEQEIVGITPGEKTDYELYFIEPFESNSNAYLTTTAVDENSTHIVW